MSALQYGTQCGIIDRARRNCFDPYRWMHAWGAGFSDFCAGYENGFYRAGGAS